MSEQFCPNHTSHEMRLCNAENDIKDLDDRVNEIDKIVAVQQEKWIAVTDKLTNAIMPLSNAILDLSKSTNEMQRSMENMQIELKNNTKEIADVKSSLDNKIKDVKKDVCDYKNKVDEIDEDGKINIRKWIKNNWFPFIIGVSALIYSGANVLKNLFT